jgi:hypothetical protein
MGRANWRLYVVILMALLAFNGFSSLFQNRVAASDNCGSAIMPIPEEGSGDFRAIGPSFNSDALNCPNTIIRANIEVIASFAMVGLLALSLLLSNSAEQAEKRASSTSHLPPPPDKIIV